MPSFRPAVLLCAAALALMCSACSVTPPAQSVSAAPEVSSSVVPEPNTSAPETLSPDEPSVPTIFVPEDTPAQPTPVIPKEPATVDPPAPEAPPAAVSAPEEAAAPEPEREQKPAQDYVQEPDAAQIAPPEKSMSNYDFSQPVPESEPVESDYFADAAFVGDSRSEGFYLYGVKRGKNLSASGLSVFTFATKKTLTVGGTRYTALEALSLKEYSKVYLGFGVNELGYINTDAFYQAYCETIDAVRTCQPHAVVYAQTMAPVNEARVAATGGARHLNNDRVRLYNDLIRKAALEKQVPLLDVYSALAVDGSLPAEASRDGVHLTGDYCRKQLEYLKTHTISFEALYFPPETEPEVLPDETPDIPASDPVPDAGADGLLPQPEQDSVSADPDRPVFNV